MEEIFFVEIHSLGWPILKAIKFSHCGVVKCIIYEILQTTRERSQMEYRHS